MSRDKQIEEMARDVMGGCDECSKCPQNPYCKAYEFASKFYKIGYRKASVGEWGFDGMSWTCSKCGEYALLDKYKQAVHSDFCPRCGAHMKGE